MSVLSAQPNPSYRQDVQAILNVAPGVGDVAGQWSYAYDSGRLYVSTEASNVLARTEVLAFDGGAPPANSRFGTGTIGVGLAAVTIANNSVTANSVILITLTSALTTPAAVAATISVGTVVPGTSFNVLILDFGGLSVNVAADVDFSYLIVN
jgi:hypothetical protein